MRGRSRFFVSKVFLDGFLTRSQRRSRRGGSSASRELETYRVEKASSLNLRSSTSLLRRVGHNSRRATDGAPRSGRYATRAWVCAWAAEIVVDPTPRPDAMMVSHSS